MSHVHPLRDRVLIERVKEDDKSHGGIIIPDTAKGKPIEGHVVAIGSGKVHKSGKSHALNVKVGDRVLFGKHEGTEINVDGLERLILREKDILAIIRA